VLSPGAARLLRLSSLHPGPEVSKAAMASLAGISPPEAAVGLEELERGHLMTRPGPGYYTSHDLVRAYAAELAAADPADELRLARTRMLGHYQHSAYNAMHALRPPQTRSPVNFGTVPGGVTTIAFDSPQDSFAWFARMYPVLRILLGQSVRLGLPESTWRLAWTLGPFHHYQARWQDTIAVQLMALEAAEQLADPALGAHSHRLIGRALHALGDRQQAIVHLELAQRRYEELGDLVEQARNLNVIAQVLEGESSEEAAKYVLRALRLTIEAGDRREQAIATNNLAHLYSNTGDQATAIEYAGQALALLDESGGEMSSRPIMLSTLGQSLSRAGNCHQALDLLLEALGMFRARRHRLEEANTLRLIAIAQRGAGNSLAARHAWQTALPVLSDLGHNLPAFEPFTLEDEGANPKASLGRAAPDPVLPLVANGQSGSQLVVQRRVVLAGFFRDGLRDHPRAARFRRGGRSGGDERRLSAPVTGRWQGRAAEQVADGPGDAQAAGRDDVVILVHREQPPAGQAAEPGRLLCPPWVVIAESEPHRLAPFAGPAGGDRADPQSVV
jgi:tetratricopeptide (TPR) repeat protein